jgi:hypothetical protein
MHGITLRKIRGCIQKFPDWVIMKYTLTFGITRWEATWRVIAAKLTRLTHKIAVQLHVVAESCTICSSRSRRPVRKLLNNPHIGLNGTLRHGKWNVMWCQHEANWDCWPHIRVQWSRWLCLLAVNEINMRPQRLASLENPFGLTSEATFHSEKRCYIWEKWLSGTGVRSYCQGAIRRGSLGGYKRIHGLHYHRMYGKFILWGEHSVSNGIAKGLLKCGLGLASYVVVPLFESLIYFSTS